MRPRASLILILLLAAAIRAQEADRDGDGLSDFQERHKYRTDPDRADSDGDGIPDGDWLERREYQYTIRAVVQVMRPVTPEMLSDDYQDVRVLDETPTHLELEVILYPFNGVGDAIDSDRDWRRKAAAMTEFLAPGPTSDWTPAMREALVAALAQDGIAVAELDDRELCERVGAWLFASTETDDGFTTFYAGFDERGRAFVPAETRARIEREVARSGVSFAEQVAREASARGMFERRRHGSCTSSAILVSGCLRALGVPTRTILAIPLVDASDEREHELIRRGIAHHHLRRSLLAAARRRADSWASHTFNEVFVGGRWRRLDQSRLGRNILARDSMGILVHVATFGDWAEARAWETIGKRQANDLRDDLFGHRNPYSTISLRDAFGPHCKLENRPEEVATATIARLHWCDGAALPADVRAGLRPKGRDGLVVELTDYEDLRDVLGRADLALDLLEEGRPGRIAELRIEPRCWWQKDDRAFVWVPMTEALLDRLAAGRRFEVRPRNEARKAAWDLPEGGLVIRR